MENELSLIVDKENSVFKKIKMQRQKQKYDPRKTNFEFNILLTFPHIGVKNHNLVAFIIILLKDFRLNSNAQIIDSNFFKIVEKNTFLDINAI